MMYPYFDRFAAFLFTIVIISSVSIEAKIVIIDPDLGELVEAQQPEQYQQRLVDWIRAHKNGFFHPSLVWKPINHDTGPYAIHTATRLLRGTKIMEIPRDFIIDSSMGNQRSPLCSTVERMLDEYYEKDTESIFAPYLSYLFDDNVGGTTTGLLPSSWSFEGQNILRFLLNGNAEDASQMLEPENFDDHYTVFELCGENFRGGASNDPLNQANNAYLFLISRSWDDKMIPVLDMLNHRNGRWLNVELSTSVHDISTKMITAYVLRDVEAGEELYLTYTECMEDDCDYGRYAYQYSTQDILLDYGFVEFYPRRWRLGSIGWERKDQIMAEIDENMDGSKQFRWIFKQPSPQVIEWTTFHYNRLKSIETKLRKDVADLRTSHKTGRSDNSNNNIEHEADTVLEMFEGYLEVLQLALENKLDKVGVSQTEFEENIKQRQEELRFVHENNDDYDTDDDSNYIQGGKQDEL